MVDNSSMTPLEAWVATTSSAAALCGVDDRLGTISPGKARRPHGHRGGLVKILGSSASVSGECGRKAFGSFEKLAFAHGAVHRVSPGTPDGGRHQGRPDGHRSTEPGALGWRRLAWLTDIDFGHAGPSPAQTVAPRQLRRTHNPKIRVRGLTGPTSALSRRAIPTRPSRPLSPDTGCSRAAVLRSLKPPRGYDLGRALCCREARIVNPADR